MQLARAHTLLKDAKISELSFATRLACTVDAVYQFIASDKTKNSQTRNLSSVDTNSVHDALKSLGISNADLQLAQRLFNWHEHRWTLPPPPCSVDEAIEWATRIIQAS